VNIVKNYANNWNLRSYFIKIYNQNSKAPSLRVNMTEIPWWNYIISEVLVFLYYCFNFEWLYIAVRAQAELTNYLPRFFTVITHKFWDRTLNKTAAASLHISSNFKSHYDANLWRSIFVFLTACLNELHVKNLKKNSFFLCLLFLL
jgi:hypothetical protein